MFAVILLATLAADQGSKAWAHTLPLRPAGCAQPVELLAHRCAGIPQAFVDGYWDWQLTYNPGVAFSTFSTFTGRTGMQVVLSLIAAIALFGITWLAMRARPDERWKRAGFALIGGGALGNLVDRLHDGAVTDFVVWRIQEHRWPIFNVADAALAVGVVVLLIDSMWSRNRAAGHG